MVQESKPAHPAMLLVDLSLAQSWWALTVPPLKALRTIGIGRPQLPKADLSGKVVIVTGATRGLGLRTATHMAEMQAKTILAVRDTEKGAAAKQGIIDELQKKGVTVDPRNIEVMRLDLLDTNSVRSFAKAFKSKYNKLDRLINNAGVSEPGITKEGYSVTFTANHIGHYLLTDLLYPVIKDTEDARVVILASVFHQYGDWKWEESATGRRGDIGSFDVLTHVYADSKLANLLHALDLRRRFEADGSSATAFAVHPGNCRTDLWRYVPRPLHMMMDMYMRVCFLSAEQGCFTTVAAAVAPLDKLREQDGKLARFLQPYWAPGPLLSYRAGHQIGPFVGYQVADVSLPENLNEELDRLRDVSNKLVQDLSKKQSGDAPRAADPAAAKGLHPVEPTVYKNLANAEPIRAFSN